MVGLECSIWYLAHGCWQGVPAHCARHRNDNKNLWPFHILPCLHVWSNVKWFHGSYPEAAMHLHEVWLLLYNTSALGGTSLLTGSNSLPSTQYSLWFGYIISSLISLYWFLTIFEVNEHPIGNNRSTSYRVGLLACRPSSRFRSMKKEGLMVRYIHIVSLNWPVYLVPMFWFISPIATSCPCFLGAW